MLRIVPVLVVVAASLEEEPSPEQVCCGELVQLTEAFCLGRNDRT